MRLQRGVEVAGIDPEVARAVARLCRGHWRFPEFVAKRLDAEMEEVINLLEKLENDGILEQGEEIWEGAPEAVWTTTIRGSALAQASFLKPISLTKAESLLTGVVERAAAYNDDPDKPLWVDRLALFGSLLNEDATDFGDVDIQVTCVVRPSDVENPMLRYAQASGRSFSSFFDELMWARTELRRILKRRSPYISLHDEDIGTFTDEWRDVYERVAPSRG